ncbi:GNAT family N-acetyltransferase [Nostoc sp. FACHB-152]|uniref:GNAT family N-acetyltransferase n=1 Tax=unclassified Nostoc TaxID=2593658 RepID=UPI001683DCB9|nr:MULTISPECIES: GNAT family N-acetyltransferase [unclassified Nostoc]MBD2451264.1 GNAT family N-acetyltransferase [Nostoc sp. FACHB-152]MBD2472441.1 GNAT family N-acetyltransferase [Nostoc sp. FACHB-145]
MNINYRKAALCDLTLVLELVEEFHKTESLPFDQHSDRDVLIQFLSNDFFGQTWLIMQADEVIGYIVLTLGYSLEYKGRDAFIDEFYLRPKYRGQGIGTQTLMFAEEICHSLGVQALHLEVDFENPKAQRLYHRIGYQKHERFLMTKLLNGKV